MIRLLFFAIFGALFFSGCAHKIDISPKMDKIREVKTIPMDINVAYYISEYDKNLEVITDGGGGDSVKYTPYADSEHALNAVLSKAFKKVYYIKTIDDKKFIQDRNISYIFTEKIVTSSSSSSLLTWPPTQFSIELTCNAINPTNGNNIFKATVSSVGAAEFSEFKHDFSLSARRASEGAFLKMLTELLRFQQLKNAE